LAEASQAESFYLNDAICYPIALVAAQGHVGGTGLEGIVQVLDQRQLLMTNIAAIARASHGIEIESHSVPCIVIAGRMPNNIDQQRHWNFIEEL
jgi:hypothetical protein